MSHKTGQCQCGAQISIPNSQCLFQCSKCLKTSLFLCHIIPQPKDLMHVRCKQCKIVYAVFTCPQCQATAVIKDFKSGSKYGCLCGFQSVMVNCNGCNGLLCLPPQQDYKNSLIECKNCQEKFKYTLCRECGQCVYLKPHQTVKDIQFCFNPKCVLSIQQKNQSNKDRALLA